MNSDAVALEDALKVVRRHWRCRTDDCRTRVLDELRKDPDRTEAILRAVIAGGKGQHRDWASFFARRVLPPDRAASVLHAAVERARRADQVDGPLQHLRELDVNLVRRYVPRLRRRLAGKDWYSMPFAMWLLADLRDEESLPAIQRAIDRLKGDHPYIAKIGSVIVDIIRGNDGQILQAIETHDHERMLWLVEAARRMGTSRARRTLDRCAGSDFDIECRTTCRRALLQGSKPHEELDHDAIRQALRNEFGPDAVPDPPPSQAIRLDTQGNLLRVEEVAFDGTRTVVYEHGRGRIPLLAARLQKTFRRLRLGEGQRPGSTRDE